MINRLFHTEDFWVYSIMHPLMEEKSLNADEDEKYNEVQNCLNTIINAIIKKAGYDEKYGAYKRRIKIVPQERNEQVYITLTYERRVGYHDYMLAISFMKLAQIAQLMYYKNGHPSKYMSKEEADFLLDKALDSEALSMVRYR